MIKFYKNRGSAMEKYSFKDYDVDGLTFLMSNRKEVVKSYQKLISTLGEHLDDKTRILITLALQVTTQQPEAVKIVIPKALKAGASSDEIIDSVILTTPIVGLTGIIKLLPKVLDELKKHQDMTKEGS
ncbi:TPA: hypothetical protein DCG86_08680 [Candidatus Marinimicrobia bacterium]|nr:hypothetical protein [Candidatus Neomarinimicrobiota bacterium]HBY18438.1 hypothetical protein [Candidatus Neomarinimicrobiota bacterium]